jgi:SAM-dependent methyltransferase
MASTEHRPRSAERHGRLWGSRAPDWAATEELQTPTYEEAIRRVGISPGARVLDIGCGSGMFLRLAADRGARVFGLDASEALVALARERVPSADARVGDMERLPFEDDAFDLVTGFNSFFFADDMVAALREARRVAKPGAPVLIQVWGRPERCDLDAMKHAARPFREPQPDAPAPPPLWQAGVLEGLAAEAGLVAEQAFDTSWPFEFPDDETLVRSLASAGGLAETAGPERGGELRDALLSALAPYRTPAGGYRLANEWHYLVTRA